ncbi:carbonate dehydratase [Scytonema hofmannii PCC 7110]|uniref:Carbonate dehydratase n=1 Tax=Scytonema hofmannii PCC 7110 TaxID=128403 RepID=A0A139X5K5_9CYAN|nr:HAD-IC family P-type ATPase [Scytonema hofmannii]KYC39987.1 carbonate dehydratase [Scytonema hofmannii PCC 7110]
MILVLMQESFFILVIGHWSLVTGHWSLVTVKEVSMAISLDKSVTNTYQFSRTQWHQVHFREVAFFLDTNLETGLASAEVERRQAEVGLNELTNKQGKSVWLQFLLQFHQPLFYTLLIAGCIKAILGSWTNAIAIWGIAVLSALIFYLQELSAERSIATVVKAVTNKAGIIRDGKTARIHACELIPGDLVLLNAGDRVPADLRLVSTHNLQMNEFSLTCEFNPVEKSTISLNENTPLAQRCNMAYAGSFVTSGQGRGIVVATGNSTELGKVSQSIKQQTSLSTPLIRKFGYFNRILLCVVFVLASLTFVLGSGQGRSWREMFEVVVALVVSAIPEGLPEVLTIILAIGVARMARRNILIRKLPVVETLSSTTVICPDMRTLTENQMTVQLIWAGQQRYAVDGLGYSPNGTIWEVGHCQPIHFGGRFLNFGLGETSESGSNPNSKRQNPKINIALRECLVAGLLCNNSHLEPKQNQWVVVGDATEGALIIVARKAGLSQSSLTEVMPKLDVIPFESDLQYMGTLHGTKINDKRKNISSFISDSSEKRIYVKGSVEVVLNRCRQMLDSDGNLVPLNRPSVELEVEMIAKQGLRVLAFAKKLMVGNCNSLAREHLESDLIFLGLQGIFDPLRLEVFATIQSCYSAGIQVKMITKDHIVTAVAIAKKLGLQNKNQLLAFEGQQLARMNGRELAQAAQAGVVFARVTPVQKLRLVEALQSKGEIVAIAGDKVNDAASLRQANIGIARGDAGTDVAKETADLLLMDDNFASIEAAVEEGQTVYQNLRHAIAFILPVNGGELIAVLLSALMSRELPLLPLQILWLNMVNSTSLAIPLAFEPKPRQMMFPDARCRNKPLPSQQMFWQILIVSVFNGILIFGMYEWIRQTTGEIAVARTMAIQTFITSRIIYLLSISNLGSTIAAKLKGQAISIQNSPAIIIGIFCTIVLQVLFSQWSFMNALFDTVPLNVNHWFTW